MKQTFLTEEKFNQIINRIQPKIINKSGEYSDWEFNLESHILFFDCTVKIDYNNVVEATRESPEEFDLVYNVSVSKIGLYDCEEGDFIPMTDEQMQAAESFIIDNIKPF